MSVVRPAAQGGCMGQDVLPGAMAAPPYVHSDQGDQGVHRPVTPEPRSPTKTCRGHAIPLQYGTPLPR